MAKNRESKHITLSGLLDAENLTIENDGVVYSLKDKLDEYDGFEVTVTIKASKEIQPLSQ
jgi:hypothetical protein